MMAALLQAGGRGTRMRAGGEATHKGLVPVLGMTMLERNIRVLLAAGFRHIAAAVHHEETELIDAMERIARPLVDAHGDSLKILLETKPLGTIGAARLCAELGTSLTVVNVDNLTTLDLAHFTRFHRQQQAAMTIAVHWEPFQMPFGEVVLEGDRVVELREKPIKRYHTSSGTYVLSPQACRLIPAQVQFGAPDLYHLLKGRGLLTAAYTHEAAWIDVNDPVSVIRAEALITEHAAAFETCMKLEPLKEATHVGDV